MTNLSFQLEALLSAGIDSDKHADGKAFSTSTSVLGSRANLPFLVTNNLNI